MMVCYIKTVRRILAKSQQVALSAVPEMVIRKCDIRRFLAVKRTVAFGLISIAAGHTVEQIAVMHPNVVVPLLQSNIVALAAVNQHNADISYLKV